jgi:recombination protein RecA
VPSHPTGVPPAPGGNAKNYAFYTRVEVSRDEWIEQATPGKGKVKVGQTIKLRTLKNKSAAPQQVASIDFYFRDAPELGFLRGEYDVVKEMVAMAVVYDVITRGGATFYFGDHKWTGKDAMFQGIREDLDLREQISQRVAAVALDPTRKHDSVSPQQLEAANHVGIQKVARRKRAAA